VSLTGITWELIEEALSKSGVVIKARIANTSGDGAIVRLLVGGWIVTISE